MAMEPVKPPSVTKLMTELPSVEVLPGLPALVVDLRGVVVALLRRRSILASSRIGVRAQEPSSYAVLADDPPKSEQRRKRRVVSQPVDVDVPRKSADDREHGRADDVADIGGVRTFVLWLAFFCATQSIPYFEGRYFRSPIG